MIFTFGRTSSYDRDFNTESNPKKLGPQSDGYPGGSVWKTREEAQAFVDSLPNKYCPTLNAKDFSVYGVLADWDTDVYKSDSEASWANLKIDAPLVKLIP